MTELDESLRENHGLREAIRNGQAHEFIQVAYLEHSGDVGIEMIGVTAARDHLLIIEAQEAASSAAADIRDGQ